MEFEVTANRKRPQTLESLAGQEFVVSTLKSSIANGRIAHAYLFSGPRGVGKTSAARIFARSLNCMEGPTAEPCGKCSNCIEITKGNSMDVIEIDGASNTSVNDVREIKDEVLFAPHSSKYKIYIIDEVHMLSNSAFNALLKTIEEPPPYIIFVFATTEIHKVPATIRSRCQQFNFRLIALEVIRQSLANVCNETGIEYEDDALLWVAKEGNGSLRDAYTLFDQVASFSDGKITLQKIREKLGLVGLDQINELAELFVDGKSHDALIKSDYILTTGVSIEQFIIEMAEYFRSILFIQHGITKESVLGYSSSRFSGKVLDNLNVTQLEYAISQIHQLHRDIRYSISPRFELELLFSKLSSLSRYITREEMLEEILELKQEILSGEVRAVKKKELTVEPNQNNTSEQTDKKVQTVKSPAESFREKLAKRKADGINASASLPAERESSAETNKRIEVQQPPMQQNSAAQQSESTKDPTPEKKVEVENNREEQQITHDPETHADPAPQAPRGEPRLSFNDLPALKEAVVKTLRRENRALSATLEKGGDWHYSKEGLFLFFGNNFEVKSASSHIPLLRDVIYDITHERVTITARTMEKEQEQSREEDLPDNIRLVKETFRGIIVQGERR